MKKILAIGCVIIVAALTARAQVAKGKSHIGGMLSYNSSFEEDIYPYTSIVANRHHYRFTVAPAFGYFLSDKIELGLRIGYISDEERTEHHSSSIYPQTRTTENDFTAGIYLTLYRPLAERFYVNVTTAANFLTGSVKNWGTELFTLTGFNASLTPGLNYFFNQHWSAGIGIGVLNFQSETRKNDDTNGKYISEDFDVEINLSSLSYGAGYYF